MNNKLKSKIKTFTIALKILRYKSNKTCTNLYAENYRMLVKELKYDLNKQIYHVR